MTDLFDARISRRSSYDELSIHLHDNCTIWEHDSAWNHVGILGDVCTLHGLNSCQCIFRRSYPILIFKCGDFVVGGKSMPIFEH
ncbi:hypothetical protein ES288_D07G038500v1 [Gossypium darwinii]|uniref:Uncharacterized protein n=1 Tax=Gossypium darwinii TaxID=34276 RepID=A0A5D2BRT8_GOSDA|nr:hypothetical protein ES288_D07G038500v1 [Gossypium darwinii]